MKRIKQDHPSGCGLACVAMIAGRKYSEIREHAREILDFNNNHDLYTDASHLRKLLSKFKIHTSLKKIPFATWEKLPEKAILGINHNITVNKWHWVVYTKDHLGAYVLDPKITIKSERRTDFNKMKPKWYITIHS
jgi:ABC-type bacteriocin/lantibiotic exporter with double-glycine peptidase domain